MNMGRVYRFGVWAVAGCLTVACSDASSGRKTAGSLAAPAQTVSAHSIANGIPAIRPRLESARAIEPSGEAFVLASTSAEAVLPSANAFHVTAPSTLAKPQRLSRDGEEQTWLEVRPLNLRAATANVPRSL